jgi:N-acetylglucosaminyldiphosphoundecaprenol N-acetyl-beta-D-mannosaminyltransferase
MTRSDRVQFLGLDFDQGTIDGAVEEVLAHAGQPFRYIVTPNIHHVVKLHEAGDELKAKYAAAWRVYCDSRILSRLARLCGLELTVVTGSDLTAALVARASELKLRVGILGPSAADCAMLGRRFPGLDIVSHAPPMGFIASASEVKKCIDFVLSSGAGITFLAVGMPQQEVLAHRLAAHPDARGVGLCIGASIDFLTGKQLRAPRWIQQMGLEWLHRLLSDPRRLARRYLVECPKICPLLIAHVIDTRFR